MSTSTKTVEATLTVQKIGFVSIPNVPFDEMNVEKVEYEYCRVNPDTKLPIGDTKFISASPVDGGSSLASDVVLYPNSTYRARTVATITNNPDAKKSEWIYFNTGDLTNYTFQVFIIAEEAPESTPLHLRLTQNTNLKPVYNARVQAASAHEYLDDQVVYSNLNGAAIFHKVEKGDYASFEVTKVGYKPYEFDIRDLGEVQNRIIVIERLGIDFCPIAEPPSNLMAVRVFNSPYITITWTDMNYFDHEMPQSQNHYELQYRPDSGTEWVTIKKLYPGVDWPGSIDPIITFNHTIGTSGDATKQYRVKAVNYCGNESAFLITSVDLPVAPTMGLFDVDGTTPKTLITFGENSYNAEEEFVLKAQGQNFYISTLNFGSGSNWFQLYIKQNGNYVQMAVGTSNTYNTDAEIKVVCFLDNPGEMNAFVVFSTLSGGQIRLDINTASE